MSCLCCINRVLVEIQFRYSDFIVNEVDREETVVQLSSLDAPEEVPGI